MEITLGIARTTKISTPSFLVKYNSNTDITDGFYNFSSGEYPNTVNALGMCRGDILLYQCRDCMKKATFKLYRLCTNQKQAILWFDNCMVRYSNKSLFGVLELSPAYTVISYVIQAPDQIAFNRVRSDLFGSLLNKTVAGNSTLKFAMNKANVSSFVSIYAFTQCTPDLSHSDCHTCLSDSISDLPSQHQVVRYFRPSCNLRFQVSSFSSAFDTLELANSSLLPPPPSPGKVAGKEITTFELVAVVVAMIVVCLLLVVVIYLCLRQKRKELKKATNELEEEDEISSTESLQIAYGDIKHATQGFAEANVLGRGGFGTVYKGVLASGLEIAVKRLARNSVQGEEEFRTEVLLVAKLQHRNLVKLLGYSLEGEERLLVYEFVPNASLDHYLFDFGMARLFRADQTHADTERIAGTFGYMAPEYVYRGIFSVKSDIYSFGVMVLEIICGQKNSSILESDNMEDLITRVWKNWIEGRACEVVDSALVSGSRVEIMRCIQMGLLCVQADPANRPTMSLVNLMLSSESQSMPVPCQPAYVLHKSMTVDPQSQNTTEEVSITELHPR